MEIKGGLKPVEILLVEDNPGDVRLTKEALKESKIINNLNVVTDGIEAIAYLNNQGDFKSKPRPELILLDLNLPKKDGREVLAEIKQDKELARIPVVILTTSEADEDILKTYELHANCYITKPVDIEQFIKVVKSVGDFWFSIVKLPPNGRIHLI
jgi:CheY-like chemotaxis protein